MKFIPSILFCLLYYSGHSQVTLSADGPGDTYSLITSVLAPDHNPIEVPDCNHAAFGEHIDEIFDNELNTNVFRFYIHTTPDDDRCIVFDRQRNEIKTYDKSPDNLLGIEDETVIYTWKFKLPAGFQSSPNFTHIHQLKSVGGDFASKPMYTLTTRKGSPDQLELRYAETDDQVTLLKTDLAPFVGTWLSVTETIKYGTEGTYDIEIKRISDDTVLFDYANSAINNWRPGGEFVRPKWGIYRSLINDQDLRDETVLFADFGIEEKVSTSVALAKEDNIDIVISNPVSNSITIISEVEKIDQIHLFSLDGKRIIQQQVDSRSTIHLDVSSVVNGTYILNLRGGRINHSRLVSIFH